MPTPFFQASASIFGKQAQTWNSYILSDLAVTGPDNTPLKHRYHGTNHTKIVRMAIKHIYRVKLTTKDS